MSSNQALPLAARPDHVPEALVRDYDIFNVPGAREDAHLAIRAAVKAAGFTRTALILVGRVLAPSEFAESRLYAADHHHVLRPRVRGDGSGQ